MYRQRDFHANGKRRQQRQPESYRQLQPRDAGSHSDGLGWSSGLFVIGGAEFALYSCGE